MRYLTTLIALCLFSIQPIFSQFVMTPEAGAFGLFGGVVRSDLGQVSMIENAGLSHTYYQGFELGLKAELYRTELFKGNIYASYIQLGSHEFGDVESSATEVTVDLKAAKAVITPFMLKGGTDFVHGYAGGGVYGMYIFEQAIDAIGTAGDHWASGPALKELDYGLNLVAGVHVWNLELEINAQYGWAELGERFDGSIAKSKFMGLSLSYMFIQRDITRKSCRKTKQGFKR
ncbi:MAG: hypothetical protein OEM26_12210 [Saprospiraceae bacterium]|nr:hypothetical protein [Saprospiraceae bacterium]